MDEFLPTITEAEYAEFRAIEGMAEPPARLGLPATYADWLARQTATVKRFEARKQKVVSVEVSLADFRAHIGGAATKASLQDLWQCAKKSGAPWEPPRKNNPFAQWGRGKDN